MLTVKSDLKIFDKGIFKLQRICKQLALQRIGESNDR